MNKIVLLVFMVCVTLFPALAEENISAHGFLPAEKQKEQAAQLLVVPAEEVASVEIPALELSAIEADAVEEVFLPRESAPKKEIALIGTEAVQAAEAAKEELAEEEVVLY